MSQDNNSNTAHRQANSRVDLLAGMLALERAPPLDGLLELAPDEPVALCDGCEPVWRAQQIALRKQFPGYQPSYDFREAKKYKSPPEDANLDAWVKAFLDTAKMHWSREILGKQTRLQFREWLPGYLYRETWFWRFSGRWDEAAQLLRLAYGPPRFRRTRRARQ
jgi:hypothetical protein